MKKRAELLGAGRARAGGGGVGPGGRASPKTTSPDAEFVKQQLRDQILASARSKRGNSFNQNRQAVRTEALGLCFSGLAANPSVVNLLGGAMGLMWIPPAPGAGGIAEETNENENMDLNGAATDIEELPSNSSTPCHRQGAASTNSNNPFSTSITRQQQQQQQQQLMQRLQQHNQLHESDFCADGMGVANDDEIDQDQDQDEDDEQRDIDVDNGNGNGNNGGSGSGTGESSGESNGEGEGEGDGEGDGNGDGEEVNEQDLLIALFGRDAFDQLMIELEEVLLSGADADAEAAGAGAEAAAAASYHYQSQGHGRRGRGHGHGHGHGEGEGEGSWVDYYAGIAPPPGVEEHEQGEHGQVADWDDSRVIVCPLCRRRPMEVDAVLLQGRCLCGPPLRLEGVAAALGPGAGAGAGAGLKEALEGLLAAEYARHSVSCPRCEPRDYVSEDLGFVLLPPGAAAYAHSYADAGSGSGSGSGSAGFAMDVAGPEAQAQAQASSAGAGAGADGTGERLLLHSRCARCLEVRCLF